MANFAVPYYEWPLEQPRGGYFPGLVLLARFEKGVGGVGQFVSFDAERRGLIFFPKLRGKTAREALSKIEGSEYRERLPDGPTFYANKMRHDAKKWSLAFMIESIGSGELVGRSAQDAVWTLFFQLVLRDKKHADWIRKLGNEWLIELCKEASPS